MSKAYSILCLDDEPAVLMTQAAVLRQSGFSVYTSKDLMEARAVLAERSIDAVIVDASVCTDSRLCVFEELRKIQPRLSVVLHTGNPEMLQQNCVRDKPILMKPSPPEDLVAKLNVILQNKS